MKRICIVAGGTGGHILPGLAVARELRRRGRRVHFILKTDAKMQEYVAKEGFPSSSFLFSGFPRRISPSALAYPFSCFLAYLAARRILKRERPDAVLGMGGYVSVPVGLAAVRRGIPLALHEQNSFAGLANRFLARWARVTATSFPETSGFPRSARLRLTGLPLRSDLVPGDPKASRQNLGLDPNMRTLFVFGGSQGAAALNRLAVDLWPILLRDWQIIHLTGRKDFEAAEKSYRSAGGRFFVRPFWDDMKTVYSAADFVVSRAGANTVMELRRMGKSALLVPYPHATDDHQTRNARFLEKAGMAAVEAEQTLTPERLKNILDTRPKGAISEAPSASSEDDALAASAVADAVDDILA